MSNLEGRGFDPSLGKATRKGKGGSLHDFIAQLQLRGVLWFPVLFALGIASYFALRFEPDALILQALIVLGLGLIGIICWLSDPWRFAPLMLLMVLLGFLDASWRSHKVAEPVLGWRYYGAIEGTIIAIDRSASQKQRITLSDPVLERVAPQRIPATVRITLHSKIPGVKPRPGARVMITGHLSPPSGPVEPGGYDFQRRAWFQKLGAVGYSRNPLMLVEEARARGWRQWVFERRLSVSDYINTRISGPAGGFAAAILTGDRSKIDHENVEALRRANLAHLLAISGLHMGLLTAVFFGLIRSGFALVPYLVLRWPVKKLAAVAALCTGFSYLMLSGGSVATQRAFIMVAVALCAVMLDRPALSLRAVAIAASIILILWPEFLMEPGFQMSFAATIALVVVFRGLRNSPLKRRPDQPVRNILRSVAALITSSLIAGLATAPFAAHHFNQIAHFGILANTLSLPVMGMVVMPSAVVAGVLSPLGLDAIPLWVMGQGINWILMIAAWVSEFPRAVSLVASAGSLAMPFVAFGALLCVLLMGRAKAIGGVGIAIGFSLWMNDVRPDLLISESGRLVGLREGDQRLLNRSRGSGFAADSWLENDGLGGVRAQIGWLDDAKRDRFQIEMNGQEIHYLWATKTPTSEINQACAVTDILIAPKWAEEPPKGCIFIGQTALRRDGAIAISRIKDGLEIKTARQVTGARLWNMKGKARRRRP